MIELFEELQSYSALTYLNKDLELVLLWKVSNLNLAVRIDYDSCRKVRALSLNGIDHHWPSDLSLLLGFDMSLYNVGGFFSLNGPEEELEILVVVFAIDAIWVSLNRGLVTFVITFSGSLRIWDDSFPEVDRIFHHLLLRLFLSLGLRLSGGSPKWHRRFWVLQYLTIIL